MSCSRQLSTGHSAVCSVVPPPGVCSARLVLASARAWQDVSHAQYEGRLVLASLAGLVAWPLS
jgi:hypothetical protein